MEFTGDMYTLNRHISDGLSGTSSIYDISYKNRRFALKMIVAKSARDLQVIQRERDILVDLISCANSKDRRRVSHGHRFIVRLQRAVQTSPIDFHMVMTLARGGDLFEQRLLRPDRVFSEVDARFYLAELSCAVRFLHVSCNVIHRDIKTENVLLDQQGHVLLGDFNLARRIDGLNSVRDEACGTYETVAPEAVPPSCDVSFASDIYSLGMLALEMVLGVARKIPENCSEDEVFQLIARGDREKTEGRTSDQFTRFVNQLLAVSSSNRPSASHLRDMPFFEAVNGWPGIDWEKLVRRKLTPPTLMSRDEKVTSTPGSVQSTFGVWQSVPCDGDDAFKGSELPNFIFELAEGT